MWMYTIMFTAQSFQEKSQGLNGAAYSPLTQRPIIFSLTRSLLLIWEMNVIPESHHSRIKAILGSNQPSTLNSALQKVAKNKVLNVYWGTIFSYI